MQTDDLVNIKLSVCIFGITKNIDDIVLRNFCYKLLEKNLCSYLERINNNLRVSKKSFGFVWVYTMIYRFDMENGDYATVSINCESSSP